MIHNHEVRSSILRPATKDKHLRFFAGAFFDLFPRPVRAKTFFTHVVSEIRHVVSKTGVFTHVKIRPERFRGYVLMCVRPSILLPMESRRDAATLRCTFMLPTGSCVDMPRHGSAQYLVIRMPGFIRRQESKRLSSSGRGEPFPTAPRRPGGR